MYNELILVSSGIFYHFVCPYFECIAKNLKDFSYFDTCAAGVRQCPIFATWQILLKGLCAVITFFHIIDVAVIPSLPR